MGGEQWGDKGYKEEIYLTLTLRLHALVCPISSEGFIVTQIKD